MSKRSNKKRRPNPALSGASVKNELSATANIPALLSLAQLQDKAAAYMQEKAWEQLLELGRLPLTQIQELDRGKAEIWQLRVLAYGLYPPDVQSIYDLSKDRRAELSQALSSLADKVSEFHKSPEFDLYLETTDWSVRSTVSTFRHLTQACLSVVNIDWLKKFRSKGLNLLHRQSEYDGDDTEDDRQLLASLPDITLALSDVFNFAFSEGSLSEADRALIEFFKLDLDLRMADPWEYSGLTEAILKLPAPDEELVKQTSFSPSYLNDNKLTARSWAFMWELEHCVLICTES